jgi:hypothetical protein
MVARGGAGPWGEGRGRCLQTANQDSGRSKGRPHASGGERSWSRAPNSSSQPVQLFQRLWQGTAKAKSGRQGTRMSGPAGLAYLDRRERVLKLGESFEKQPRCAFHTVRCECRLYPGFLLGWEGGMETDSSGFCNSVPAALCSPGDQMAQ